MTTINRRFLVRRLLPVVAAMTFIAMLAISESQERSAPKWPPPPRHELGGWNIKPPRILDFAAFVNLPASIPILWMSANSDAFTYVLDEHDLIVYLPWIFFVCCLWYLVAYRLDHFVVGQAWKSLHRNVVLCSQAFITVEMLWAASVMRPALRTGSGKGTIVCVLVWSVLAVLGWLDFVPIKVRRTLRIAS